MLDAEPRARTDSQIPAFERIIRIWDDAIPKNHVWSSTTPVQRHETSYWPMCPVTCAYS
jgi:hypothetical protein